jgi:hypothetical protein
MLVKLKFITGKIVADEKQLVFYNGRKNKEE